MVSAFGTGAVCIWIKMGGGTLCLPYWYVMMKKILSMRSRIYLAQEGYRVLKAYDGLQALEILKTEEVHLILLDVMMPKLDGIHTMMKIRETSSVPIIVLSAKSQDTDKVLGLNLGADDYVAKPFNPLELLARVKSQIRRYTNFGSAEQAESEHIYRTGGLVMNDDRKEVTVDGEPSS